MMIQKFILPIIKCVGIACNLRCRYCFYRDLDQTPHQSMVMSDDVLRKTIYEIMSLNQKIHQFIWHGGEPLLAGLDFFKRVVAYQQEFRSDSDYIDNRIQTNGVLLSDEWIDFFITYRFSVGVSIDGDALVHDRNRVDHRGRGTHDVVFKAIQRAQQKGLRIGVIAMVTSWSAQFPDEIYQFFVSNGITRIAFNPVFELDSNGRVCDFSVSEEAYTRFLMKILELWSKDDDPQIQIRQIQEPLEGLLLGRTRVCVYSGNCAQNISIYPNGDVTPCHDIIKGQRIILGNIKYQSLSEILNGPAYQAYNSYTKQFARECLDCRWFSICNGGCTYHRDLEIPGVPFRKYVYCGSRRAVFEALEKKIQLFFSRSHLPNTVD